MKSELVLFLILIASVFASKQSNAREIALRYLEDCVDKCIEDKQEKYNKNPEPEWKREKPSQGGLGWAGPERRRLMNFDDDFYEEYEYENGEEYEYEDDKQEQETKEESEKQKKQRRAEAHRNLKYKKECENKCRQRSLKNIAGKTSQKIQYHVQQKVNKAIDTAVEESFEVAGTVITTAISKIGTTITALDNFQNKAHPYGLFLQNYKDGLTMVYQNFEAKSGEQVDFLNLSKGRDSLSKEKIEHAEIGVVKLANRSIFTGVSGTSKINIYKGEKKHTTLEVYVENPKIGGYKCCITEEGKEIGNNPCLPNDKEKLKSKKGFFILKEPQWKKFDSGDVRFCRIVIYGNDLKNGIPAAPDATELVEEQSRQSSYDVEDGEEDGEVDE